MIRFAFATVGIVTALLVAYWSTWFYAVTIEPEYFTVWGTLFWLCFGAIFGAPFICLALLGHRASRGGQIARLLAGITLVAPAWLFGTFAYDQFRRLIDGEGFVTVGLAVACIGLASVLGAIAYAIATEVRHGAPNEV